MNFEKIGGIASLMEVLLSIFFFVAIFMFSRLGLGPDAFDDPTKIMAVWEASPTTFYLLGIDLILWSPTFIILVLSLRHRLLNGAPVLMMISLIGATISATLWLSSGVIEIAGKEQIILLKDISAFNAITATSDCLTSAGDFVFGWVILLIGSAGIKTSKLPYILSWVLVAEGICFIFALVGGGLIFLGLLGLILAIISNFWLGIILISSKTNAEIELTNG